MNHTDEFSSNRIGTAWNNAKEFFLWIFQPAVLFLTLIFWAFAPDRLVTVQTLLQFSLGLRIVCLLLERVSERHPIWRLTWTELAFDLFFLALVYNSSLLFTFPKMIIGFLAGNETHQYHVVSKTEQFLNPVPMYDQILNAISFQYIIVFFVQIVATIFIIDLAQYFLHRLMHNWRPLWIIHAPHHFVNKLNTLKDSVGNLLPVYLAILTRMAAHVVIGHLFDTSNRVGLASGAVASAIGIYSHANIRFNTPRWWSYAFNTIEHHSLHHSQIYRETRCNFATNLILIDRIFGTYVDGETALVGQDGGRFMSIKEHMLYPATEGYRWLSAVIRRNPGS